MTNSFAYAMTHDTIIGQMQDQWRSCFKCQGLFYGPFNGRCPAGGEHNAQNSFNYSLPFTPITIPAIAAAYLHENGAYGRLGTLSGFAVQNPDRSHTQQTAMGRITTFDNNPSAGTQIDYFYPVLVELQAVKCFGTMANWPDNTDALYAIASLVAFGGAVDAVNDLGPLAGPITTTTPIVNTQQGNIVLQNISLGTVLPGSGGVYVYLTLWQHKSGDPNQIKDKIHQSLNDLVNEAASAAASLAGDPATAGGGVGDVTNQKVAGVSINDLTLGIADDITNAFFADRLIAAFTYNISYQDVVRLSTQAGVNSSIYIDPDLNPDVNNPSIKVNWPPTAQANQILNQPGPGSYKAYFMVTAQAGQITTHPTF